MERKWPKERKLGEWIWVDSQQLTGLTWQNASQKSRQNANKEWNKLETLDEPAGEGAGILKHLLCKTPY